MKRAYITFSIHRDDHTKLKRLANQKGIPMASYVSQMIQYFKVSGRDPEELPMDQQLNHIQKVKTGLEQVKRIIKSQENKLLNPLAEAVFGMEKSIASLPISSNLSTFVGADIVCPQCGASLDSFLFEDDHAQCGHCPLKFRMRMGQYQLSLSDIIALLSGGMTRFFSDISAPNGSTHSGRLYLSPQHFTLNIYKHDH